VDLGVLVLGWQKWSVYRPLEVTIFTRQKMEQQNRATSPELQQTASTLRVGTVVDDRFEILEYLGCGGMGSVFKARQLEFDRIVALKTLHPRFCADASAVRRFQREAQIISTMNHNNVLAVYAFGEYEGVIYLAMEFVQGRSLGHLIEQRGPLKPEDALPLFLQICDGMAHAHANEVLHRDLKPDNVMVLHAVNISKASAKVVDFGLSKLLDGADGQRLTRTGEVVGDPRYMSPEQCRGEKLDIRSDVYSFGCLMYEVLTGRWPFEGDDPVAILHKHISEDPAPFAKRLGLPPSIEAITFTAMAKDPQDRYESFEGVSKVLQEFQKNPNLKIAAPARRGRGSRASQGRKVAAIVAAICVAAIGAGAFLVSPDEWPILATKIQYQAASNSVDKIKSGFALADYYAQHGMLDEAASIYHATGELANKTGDTESNMCSHAGLGRVYFEKKQATEAVQAYQQAFGDGLSLIRGGKSNARVYETLRSSLSNYAQLEPLQVVQVAHELSAAYTAAGLGQNARGLLELVEPLAKGSARASTLVALAGVSLQEGDVARAERYFDNVLATADNAQFRIQLLQMCAGKALAAGRHALATKYFEKALAETETSKNTLAMIAMLKIQIADCHCASQNLPLAKQKYAEALALARSDPKADKSLLVRSLHGLGQVEYHSGNPAAAEKALREEVSLLTQSQSSDVTQLVNALCMVGDSLTMQKRYYQAANEFQQALNLIDSPPNNRAQLGSLRLAVAEKYRINDATPDPSRPKR
jgi:tetratricopeptide (TPR) repeat protein